ncbi:uncharacterized protein YkwD [Paraburkholderia graminis]|uniref:CAP domain-containing protein n=1 Tax=Paraburkholderia graminis TaxID=60548 RepID=UPI002855BEF5|nr:CAP domain-containing protein [Paraburkholderia graminis]MDR6472207.1 uncharacterized protein YkwD [Paraburkholderia graminis]
MEKASTSFASTVRLGLAGIVASAALAACGGGGSDQPTDTKNNAGNQKPSTPTTVTLMQPAATAQTVSASGDPTADGITFVNVVRQNVGLSPLLDDATLKAVSKSHTVYLVDNQTTGHYETVGLPGYSGQSPFTRGSTVMGEVVVAGDPRAFTNSLGPVQDIFDAPYHRLLMLGDFSAMGVANTTSTTWQAFNIDFGGTSVATNNVAKLVAYPYPGQTDVTTQWYAAENPNPFASQPQYQNTYVGYPISLQGASGTRLTSISFVVTDDAGNSVSCQKQTPDNDSELSNGAMCVPFAPFKSATTYTVHATGVLTGYGIALPVDVSWQFKTGQKAVSNVMGIAPQQRPVPQF